jgi:hypothetical protein
MLVELDVLRSISALGEVVMSRVEGAATPAKACDALHITTIASTAPVATANLARGSCLRAVPCALAPHWR